MINNNINFYSQSHYFDIEGHVHDIEVGSTKNLDPQLMGFLKKDGSVLQLYLANNPWRATTKQAHSKIHQYCVFCNTKRFENKIFHGTEKAFKELMDSKVRSGGGECLFQCKDLKCQGEKWFDLADNLPSETISSIFTLNNTYQLPEIVAQDQLKMLSQKV
jgi:hypothetical protein